MASLNRSPYGVYQLTVKYAGQRVHRSLSTKVEAEALRLKGVVENTLAQLVQGLLDVPDHLTTDQLWRLLLSGGRKATRPQIAPHATLEQFSKKYFKSYTTGTKEASTLATEQHHLNHLKRLLGSTTSITATSGPLTSPWRLPGWGARRPVPR